jgi:hypothetical protein
MFEPLDALDAKAMRDHQFTSTLGVTLDPTTQGLVAHGFELSWQLVGRPRVHSSCCYHCNCYISIEHCKGMHTVASGRFLPESLMIQALAMLEVQACWHNHKTKLV